MHFSKQRVSSNYVHEYKCVNIIGDIMLCHVSIRVCYLCIAKLPYIIYFSTKWLPVYYREGIEQ